MINALVIHEKDNVFVAIENIEKNSNINYKSLDGKSMSLVAKTDIPIYHKIALRDVKKDDFLIKYGEHIGVASTNILMGEHVHEHNIESKRECLI